MPIWYLPYEFVDGDYFNINTIFKIKFYSYLNKSKWLDTLYYDCGKNLMDAVAMFDVDISLRVEQPNIC